MKKGFWIITALMLMTAITCSIGPTKGQENSATVIETVNKVDAHPRPKGDWGPAEVDMVIFGGGQVRTGAESSAQLELLEGVVRLSAESIFTVKESATREGRLETTLFLGEGRLWAHLTTSQPHEFIVETASAVAAVRDTHFCVKADPDQTTLVSVAEGEVEVTAQGESVTVVAGQQTIVKPGQPPSPPEPMSDEERELWGIEDETEPKIVFPEDGQIIWGTINVLLALPGIEVPEVVFAYDGGEGFVDFAVDDGTVIDSDFVRQDRFGTWDTSELPRGDYILRAQAHQIVIPEITVTVVDEPQVDFEWSVVDSGGEVTRVLLSASEISNPDLYQLSYTWIFADGSILEGDTVEREFAGHPVCHQAIQDDYQMLHELAPEEMAELKPLVEKIMAGPCVEPVVLSYSSPGGMWGEEAMLVSIDPVQTAEVAYASASPISTPAISISKVYAHDTQRINKLSREANRTMATLLKAYKAGGLTKKQKSDLGTATRKVYAAYVHLVTAKTSLKLNRLPKAISQVAEARKALREASKLVRTINALKDEADKLDLASAGATAAWGRLRLVELIGNEAEKVTSPTVKTKAKYEEDDYWEVHSHYAIGSKDSKAYCTQFLVVEPTHQGNDAVILHEFGHHAMYKTTMVKWEGGSHGFDEEVSENLAWTEGWAHFLSAVLRNDSWFTATSRVATFGLVVKQSIDLEEVTLETTVEGKRPEDSSYEFKEYKDFASKGPDVEASVAGILWDLYDNPKEDDDSISIEFKYIWKAMEKSMEKSKAATDVGTVKRFYEELIKIIDADEKLKKDIDKTKIEAIFRKHNVPVVAPPAPTEEPAAPTEEPTAAPTEEPTATPTEEPTATPTEEEEAVQTITDQVFTPTPTPAPTFTPTPTAGEYVAEGMALFERGCQLLKEHADCYPGIKDLEAAIKNFTTALGFDPNDAYALFGRGMSLSCLDQDLNQAIEDLQRALDMGLEDDPRVKAETELAILREKVAAPISVTMGPIICAQAWTEDNQPIEPATEFSGCIREITCRWELINPAGERGTTKWELNGELRCQHPTELPPDATWDGSSWTADGPCMLPGLWCVWVQIADQEVNRTCFTVTE